jgi:outer membrane protein assembly factor BamB
VDDQFLDTVDLVYPFTPQPLARYYGGLGAGPHVARVSNNAGIRVDAFASNQPAVAYRPLAEWWESSRTAGGSIFGGIHVPAAVGDVTGDGTPIIWSEPFDIFNGFEDVGAPAVADLDGQPGAEIVMSTVEGMYAFHNDGTTYWFTDTVRPHVFFGTPAIGNLDLDAAPEIVINMDDTLVVFEGDGAIAWTFSDADGLTMPLLADLNGDGLLDILFHDWNDTLYLYDYNLGNSQLIWSASFANPLHGYGGPAVADLDGDRRLHPDPVQPRVSGGQQRHYGLRAAGDLDRSPGGGSRAADGHDPGERHAGHTPAVSAR